MTMVKFTYCKNFAQAETREAEWPKFASALGRSEGFDTKEQSIRRAAIVGGLRGDETLGRADGNIVSRTVAMIDYDEFDGTLEDVEFALTMGFGEAFAAYSTFRHTPEKPRFRIAFPLSRAVNEAEYKAIVGSLVATLGLGKADGCSYSMSQIMFLPSHRNGIEPWAFRQDGEFLDVNAIIEGAGGITTSAPDVDDLDVMIAAQPLDIGRDEIDMLLDTYEAEGLDYDQWLEVGMGLYHQFEGRSEGFDLWVSWSEKSTKHDPRQMKTKWRSFGGSARPITLATTIKRAGGRKAAMKVEATSAVAMTLEQEARAVCDKETYTAFKRRIQALSIVQLPNDVRSMLAAEVHGAWAKGAGLGLREVKAALKPPKVKREDGAEPMTADAPEWLEDWVYAEDDCVFVNTSVNDYAIKREAFRAKFDRMPECTMFETDAASYALNLVQIPTVKRPLYWPAMPRFFSERGVDYVNSYYRDGVEPCAVIDADGQAVVDLFLEHLDHTFADERERQIVLDWMAHVYQREDRRVRWALLLWGIEGNGKSFFFQIMQLLLGRNARVANTSVIARPFNDWIANTRLVGVEEIRIAGTNKYMILDQLKPMISNDVLQIEPKGGKSYNAPNFANVMMMTNHQDAIPMGDNDRRYCVIFTRHTCKEELFEQHGGKAETADYFNRLFKETRRRADALARFLADYKISAAFDPDGRAPETLGGAEMRDANVSEDRVLVEEAMEDYACDIIGSDIVDATMLNERALMDAIEIPKAKAFGFIMRDMGYRPIKSRCVKIGGKKRYLWVRSSKVTDDEAKERARQYLSGTGSDFSDVPF